MNKRDAVRLVCVVVAILAALLLAGCGTLGVVKPDKHQLMMQELAEGKVVLNCGGLCAGTFIFNEDEIWRRVKAGDFEGVAVAVMRTHWRQDITYFLLGLSAENLGMLPAAERYYRFAGALSVSPNSVDRCATAPTPLCGPFTLPRDINVRLVLVRRAMADQRAALETPAPSAAPAEGEWIDPPPVDR